jgi:hypothetical protein
MEIVKGIVIPVVADYVLSPDVFYGNDLSGIYFQTVDNQFGRITFNNLDSIKVCRGEMLPYEYKWGTDERGTWVFKIENSKWLTERFKYENENYGSSYEFGGNVNEMLTDFSHYLFSFHDQFVEVIARGFWFEKSEKSLFTQPLQFGHPLLNLPETKVKIFEIAEIKYKAIFNPTFIDQLIDDSQYCQQPLIEIATEFEEKYSISYTLLIMQRKGKLMSVLRHRLGKSFFEKEGVATFDDIKPLIDKEIFEIAERRKHVRK